MPSRIPPCGTALWLADAEAAVEARVRVAVEVSSAVAVVVTVAMAKDNPEKDWNCRSSR
jgi:hypothetical protein